MYIYQFILMAIQMSTGCFTRLPWWSWQSLVLSGQQNLRWVCRKYKAWSVNDDNHPLVRASFMLTPPWRPGWSGRCYTARRGSGRPHRRPCRARPGQQRQASNSKWTSATSSKTQHRGLILLLIVLWNITFTYLFKINDCWQFIFLRQ